MVLILAPAVNSANGKKGEWEKMIAASVPTDIFVFRRSWFQILSHVTVYE
jgi:hypothetical protein